MGRKGRHKSSSLQDHDQNIPHGNFPNHSLYCYLLFFPSPSSYGLLVEDVGTCQLATPSARASKPGRLPDLLRLTADLQLPEVLLDLPLPGLLEVQV